MNKRKILLFKSMAFLLPILLLIFLELALRLLGYGHDLSLFVEDADNADYLVMNSHASEKFFSNPANASIGNFEKFREKKLPGTFRIFVLGESTTIGYPYMHNGSFHRLLQYRLMHTFPDINFEIINLSLTAVNSYTVLDFAQTVAGYEPDAVMIYTGHNEYYGALGIGSTNRISGSRFIIRTMIKLRQFRTVQLLTSAVNGIQGLFAKKTDADETLMKKMAGDQQIAWHSEKYEKGIRQFSDNINETCRLLSKKNIPVFISNLVSNEKDLKPFISSKEKASALDQFNEGTIAYAQKDYLKAKQFFIKAKDLDLLRFRAPDTFNAIIARLPATYPGVYLVDAKSLFEQHSSGGILGAETLLEHVHPNLYGYALLSEAFYQSLKRHGMIAAAWPNEMPFDQLLRDLPVTKVDSIKGALEIASLKMQWPFNDPVKRLPVQSFEEKLAAGLLSKKITWTQVMDTLMPYYIQQNNYPEALRVAESAMLEYPYDATFYELAGKFSIMLSRNRQASLYMQKAYQLNKK
jgi:lysophospholipase L1-like esterase